MNMTIHKQVPTDPVDVYDWEIFYFPQTEVIGIGWQQQLDRYQPHAVDKRSHGVRLKAADSIVVTNAEDAKFCYEMLQEFFRLLKAAMAGRATEVRISVTQEEPKKESIN